MVFFELRETEVMKLNFHTSSVTVSLYGRGNIMLLSSHPAVCVKTPSLWPNFIIMGWLVGLQLQPLQVGSIV